MLVNMCFTELLGVFDSSVVVLFGSAGVVLFDLKSDSVFGF